MAQNDSSDSSNGGSNAEKGGHESAITSFFKQLSPISVIAGGAAGVASTIVTNPFDTLRSRLGASREATDVLDKRLTSHIKVLFKNGMTEGLFRGLLANLICSVPSNAIYLSSYKLMRETWSSLLGYDPNIVPLLSSSSAVCCTNMVLGPLFTIRSQVQCSKAHLSMRDCFNNIWGREGFKGLYRGTATNMGGRFVEEGLFWMIFENLKYITNEGSFGDGKTMWWASIMVISLSSVAKMIGAAIAYPYQNVMTHIRTPNAITGKHEHHFVGATAKYIYKKDGIVGFYRGLVPQLIRSALSKSTQIFVFEWTLEMYAQMMKPPEKDILEKTEKYAKNIS